jgi:tRNA (guanine-N7-)-methyltransferase
MNVEFLAEATRALAADAPLHFWTDVQEYFEQSLSLIEHIPALAGPFEVAEKPAEHDLDYRTHFERRTRISELPVYRAEFRKLAT